MNDFGLEGTHDVTKIDKKKFRVWTWKHVYMLHWMINPGLAINELILGQRIPRVILVERNSTKALADKTFIPCPHCNTLHSGLKWTPQNKTAFGNWFGYYCDQCGNIIPCLRNLTSALILVLTFPIWYWFKDRWKEKWLERQKAKFSRPMVLTSPDFKWWYIGLQQGMFMYVAMEVFMPLVFDGGIRTSKLLIGIPVWIVGGALFGLLMKAMVGKKKNPKSPGLAD